MIIQRPQHQLVMIYHQNFKLNKRLPSNEEINCKKIKKKYEKRK